MDARPLFDSTHKALTFAYNVRPHTDNGSIYKLGDLEAWQREGKGLGGLDGPAQAGMILAMVGRLPHGHKQLITAKFEPRHHPCSCKRACCSGVVPSQVWIHAMMAIASDVDMKVLSGKHSSYSLRRELVHKFFGKMTTIQDMAEVTGAHRNTVADHWRLVNDYLKDEMHRADCEITEVLQQAGIVEIASEQAA